MTLTVYSADDIPQGSDTWRQARAGIVTASVVGKLLTASGKVANNETSRALTDTLIAERITQRADFTPPTRDMMRGTLLEPYARAEYEKHYGPVEQIGFARRDEDFYTLGASPDGLIGTSGGIEIKCPRERTHLDILRAENVPAHYLPQIHACMHVLDRDWWQYVSYAPGLPLFTKRVHRDDKWDRLLVEACSNFQITSDTDMWNYQEHVLNKYPPTDYFDPFEEEEIHIG